MTVSIVMTVVACEADDHSTQSARRPSDAPSASYPLNNIYWFLWLFPGHTVAKAPALLYICYWLALGDFEHIISDTERGWILGWNVVCMKLWIWFDVVLCVGCYERSDRFWLIRVRERADRLAIRFNYIEEGAGFLKSTARTLYFLIFVAILLEWMGSVMIS